MTPEDVRTIREWVVKPVERPFAVDRHRKQLLRTLAALEAAWKERDEARASLDAAKAVLREVLEHRRPDVLMVPTGPVTTTSAIRSLLPDNLRARAEEACR